MNFKSILRDFLAIFVIVLVVSAIVSYLYSLIVHGIGVIDWGSSFRLAIIFGIVFPAIREMDRRRKQ